MWPGVDLVVVNYQTPADLFGFLSSYEESNIEIPNTLHVVNVEPRAADRAVVEGMSNSIPFLYSEHVDNIGYARACNAAAKYPDREVVAFFNADTRLAAGVVERCHEEIVSNAHVGVVGPRQVDDFGRITSAGIFGTHSKPLLRGWREADRGQYVDVEDCVSVSGSAYFVDREMWDELTRCPMFEGYEAEGAFLPTRHYYEETYLSYHAAAHGWSVRYVGEATMVHKWHGASSVGVVESLHMTDSRKMFRQACDVHGLPHD